MIKKPSLIILATIVFNISAANAAPQFFESLYDVPLMVGMSEIEDESLTFDKPSGRISKAAGLVLNSNPAAIEAYYDAALKQMGWQAAQKLTYIRKQEQLVINIVKSEGYDAPAHIVSFDIEPVS